VRFRGAKPRIDLRKPFQTHYNTTFWLQVSFVGCGSGENEKIAFNYGRELFVYPYRGIRKSSEAKLLDKRVYKVRQLTVPSALEKFSNKNSSFLIEAAIVQRHENYLLCPVI
jgi:hypothetical protein